MKNAAIEVYTDKIASARNPRNGIRAQAGWTDAIGDFFRPSEETKHKRKEKNTSPNLCENKEGMRAACSLLLLFFIFIFYLYIKTKYGIPSRSLSSSSL